MENNERDFFDIYNIKDISKKTMISEFDLQILKNKEFDKTNKSKGLGFIKIIEREYLVDLSELKKELITYLKEHDKIQNTKFFIPPPAKKNNNKILAVFFLLLIIIAGIFYMAHFRKEHKIIINTNGYKATPAIKEAKRLVDIKFSETNESNESNETNKSIANILDINDSNESNNTDKILSREQNKTVIKQGKTVDNNMSNFSVLKTKNNLIIEPKTRIWVGEIDLNTHEKKSYTKDSNISIPIKDNTLVVTGHGYFKLFYKGKKFNFSTKSPMRFFIKDNNISQITKDEFIKLNKGKY